MNYIDRIIAESLHSELVKARKDVDRNPTEKQKEAGNYRKGHVSINGFMITIENPKGSYRKGKDKSGKEWKTLMRNDYGYFTRTLGKDGDAVDVFIGPNLNSDKIYPIDQYIGGEFDETKVMLGFDSKEEAKAAYLSNYEKDWKGFKYITEVDIDTFKEWLYNGRRQRKPFAKYKSLNEGADILNEAFNSRMLANLAAEHGGIEINRNGGLRDFPCAFLNGHGVNPSEITDDMLVGEPFEYSPYDRKSDNAVLFNDGTAIALRSDSELRYRNAGEKRMSRYGSGIGDTGDHDKRRGGFIGNGKDAVSAPYNGYSVSQRAGDAQRMRRAIENNRRDIDYIDKHRDDYRDWRERISRGNRNIDAIKSGVKSLKQNKPR